MRVLAHTGVIAMLIALVACGSATEPPTPATSRQSSISLPPRPQEITVDGLDPCSLLTDEQRARLDVGGERFTPASSRRGALCQWSHSPDEPIEGYAVALVPDLDPAQFVGRLKGHSAVTTIAGFPAIVTDQVPSGLPIPGHCSVLLGVAENQSVQVGYDYSGTELNPTIEQSCEKARTAAEMVMRTLIDRAGGGR